jgi:hypothetical protein
VTDKREREDRATKERKQIVASLFEESGEVAPIDFRRFGKCVGEIIAGAAHPHRKAKSRRQH